MMRELPNRSSADRFGTGATKHSAFLITAFVAIAILNYLFGVALSWFFTPAQFGVLGVAQALLLLTALIVGSGFAWSAAHDFAASGVTSETRRRFRAAWLANVALGLSLGAGLWIAYALDWLPLGPAYRTVMPLIGLTTILLAARSVVNGAVRGTYSFGSLAVNQVGEVVIKAGTGLVLVVAGFGVPGVMAGFALGTTAALVHSFWISHPVRLWRGKGWADRGVLIATAPLFVGMLGTALILNLDILGLKLLSPPGRGDELAGFYQAAVILARAPVFVAQSLSLVLFSYIARTKGPLQTVERPAGSYMQGAVRTWARLLLPVSLALALAPRAALSIFFPSRYQAAAPALQLAAAGGALLTLVTLLSPAFQAAGDRRRPAIAAGLATVSQLIVLIWLVPRWGAVGAAFSLLAAGVVASIGLGPSVGEHLGPKFSNARRWRPLDFLRAALPMLALAVPLIMLPDGGPAAAILKFGLASLGYVTALIATHTWSINGSNRSAAHLFSQFVHILIGG